MRPLGFLTGVVLGSAASIALVLLMVVAVFVFAPAAAPTLAREYPGLLGAAVLFAALAATAAAAFLGEQRERPWRWVAQAAMWAVLAGIAWHYWPEGGRPGG
jgi:hypothetical protein